jgi:hypothetical protein
MYSRISSKISVKKTGIQNLSIELEEKQLQWCGHVKKWIKLKRH